MPLPHNIAIVSLTRDVLVRDLLMATAAIQKQVTRDFAPIWGYPGNIDAFADLESVPSDYHPVVLFREASELAARIAADLGAQPAARVIDAFERNSLAGIHLNSFTRQPFALVSTAGPWTVALSHEVLELLSNPSLNEMVAARHPTDPNRRVKYLLEVCDPCQSIWYPVNGVPVSDFYTPRFFDPVVVDGLRYSFTGELKMPRDIVEGGYMTFLDPATSELYQYSSKADGPQLLAGEAELRQSGLPLRVLVDNSPRTPFLTSSTLRAAASALESDAPLVSADVASSGTAQATAEAVYALAMSAV